MGVERWFERKQSDLRAEAKTTSTGAASPWGRAPHPPPRLATARHAASAAPPLRHEPQDDGRVKTSPEGRRTTSLGEEGRRTTHVAFHGVLSAGRKRFGEGFASALYISNK